MWYPSNIFDYLDILWIILKAVAIITLAPSLYEIFEGVILRIFATMLRVIRIRRFFPYDLRKGIYQLFPLGGWLKQLMLIGIANALGYKIRAYTTIRENVTGGTTLRTDGDLQDSFILVYSSYIFVIGSYLLFLWRGNILEIFILFGMNSSLAFVISWWIILSLFLTGRPEGQELIFPFRTIIQVYPNIIIMLVSIAVTSLLLYPALGIYYMLILIVVQLSLLFLLEKRRERRMTERNLMNLIEDFALLDDVGYFGDL